MKNLISCVLLCLIFMSAKSSFSQTKDKIVPVGTTVSVILEENDGRFTLGNGDKRLMYGFPVPLSTSHFVVKIDTIFLTNSPWLVKKGVHYLKGKTTLEGAYTLKAVTEYSYKKYKISQTVMPIDKELKEIADKNKFAQYYQTVVDVTNSSGVKVKAGCIMLYDTMIEDNDACVMGTGKKKYTSAQKLMANNIPNMIQVFKDTANPTASVGECRPIIAGKRADEIYVGNWPLLHGCTWNIPDETGLPYHDSAILLKWREKDLTDGASFQFSAAYGIPSTTISQLKLIMNEPGLKSKMLNVYFDLGKAELDLNGDMAITDLLNSTSKIAGVTLHGHSDAYGGSEAAMELSKKRIDVVKKYFDKKNIVVIPKPHGNYESEISDVSTTKGNVKDRKVVIELFYR